jgi:hypothetical protein
MITKQQRSDAYAEIKKFYGLNAAQRDVLDRCVELDRILTAAHANRWATVEMLLWSHKILTD